MGCTDMISYLASSRRTQEIKEILADLEALKAHTEYSQAAGVNISFFKAIRSPVSFLWWLIFKAPALRRNRSLITEIGDLPLPKWQRAGLDMLSGFEAMVPGTLRLVKERVLSQIIESQSHKTRPIVMLSLGCGGMELERQVIYELIRQRSRVASIFVGADYSPIVPEIVTDRFKPLLSKGLLQMETATEVDLDQLNRLKVADGSQQFRIIILNTNAFELECLPENFFDCAYHTRLAHHLTAEEHRALNRLALHLAPRLIEFDDLFSIRSLLLASFFAWRFPAGFGGVIFSYLRDHSRRELLSRPADGAKIEVAYTKPIWCYLKEYQKEPLLRADPG
jgi:hypothetical protein